MKKIILPAFLMTALILLTCRASYPEDDLSLTILMDVNFLSETKIRIEQNDPKLESPKE